MPLQPQSININFSQGLDTKTDPWQVPVGKFLSLSNSVFNTGGRLTKRNGFQELTVLPDGVDASYATTFNDALTVIGNSVESFAEAENQWIDGGTYYPCNISVLPLIRSNTNQSQVDSAIAPNGYICVVYTDQEQTSLSTNQFTYAILNSVSGQMIVPQTVLPSQSSTYSYPRVFVVGNYFVIIYQTATHLIYEAINYTNTTSVSSGTISTSLTPSTSLNFDAAILNDQLYVAWCGASTTGIKIAYITRNLVVSSTVILDGTRTSTQISVATDELNGVVYVTYYKSSSDVLYTVACNGILSILPSFPIEVATSLASPNITSIVGSSQLLFIYAEVTNAYSFDSSIPTNYIHGFTVNQNANVDDTGVCIRSVGLASKPFISNGYLYFLTAYQSNYQTSYFLVGSLIGDSVGQIVAKLAYENGGGYLTHGLPSITVSGDNVSVAYLYKDLIEAINKGTNLPSGTAPGGVYSQTGINMATFTLNSSAQISALEIGNTLNINGGFLWTFDGVQAVENDFYLFPDLDLNSDGSYHGISTSTSGGFLTAQQYFYQFTYEWTDNQGNAYRSAPSVPITITTTGTTSENTIDIPLLRLTYKIDNPVKIVGYRWSEAQQNYYQFTSIEMPTLNLDILADDSVEITDSQADSSILGNNLLYTTGGVVEDIGPPAFNSLIPFDDRLWGVTGEDTNLLWFSKQVIENTPVEMSDVFTTFVAPTLGAQGSTGPITALSAMDDKLIIFKKDAIYYLNGTGPDNTGSNSQYSQPIFITATVGCANQNSIVFIPNGLMFQSDKGIWILGRDLSTQYIGAPVEKFNSALVESAVAVPGTNQVRFTLNTGITLMYDYYYQQWGTFEGIPGVSSTLYQNLHTFVDSFNRVFQENPGSYLDGANPVLLSFTTSWIAIANLQGYERIFFFYILGQYYSPHKLNMQLAYDYNPSPIQSTLVTPVNFAPTYGLPSPYGQGSPYGGPGNVEQWRIFPTKIRCQSFQITLNEIYDPTLGSAAGQGLTLSGLNIVAAVKKGYRPISAANSAGGPQ